MRLDTRTAGFTVAVVGVVAVGPDTMLLRTQNMAGGSTAVISVWRYILLCVANLVAALVFEGNVAKLLAGVRRSWWPLFFASVLIVLINIGFTISLLKCDAAKALLLISLNPLWAALLGKMLLNDALPRRTIIAQCLSVVSTLLVFGPALMTMLADSVGGSDADATDAAGDATGGDEQADEGDGVYFDILDFVPLLTGVTIASLLTFSRWQASASLEFAPCLGAFLTACCSLTVMTLFDGDDLGTLVVGLEPLFWLALVGSAVGSAVYDSALVIAPRSLSSAEVALILLGETIFGPFWVWVVYGDMPGPWTVAGGALLLLTLVGHEVTGILMAYHRRAVDAKSAIAADSSEEGSSTVTLLNIGGHRSPQLSERLRRTSREGGGNSNGSSLDYQHDGKTQPLLDEVEDVFYLRRGTGSA